MNFPFSYEEFKAIYSKVPRLNVEAIVKTDNGIVLSRRSIEPWKGLWHIPGGTVYMYESLEDAVRRTAQDELGVSVDVHDLLGYITYPSIKTQNTFGWPIGIAYLATVNSGELHGSEQGQEVIAFKTLPKDIIPEHRDFLLKHKLAEES